jgi:chorismate mutase-like protein
MEDLRQLRDAIDTIDGKLLGLLNDRARLAQEIGRIKERNGRPVYAPERAEQLMRRLAEKSAGPLDAAAIRAIYIEIMSASLALEKEMLIACEGSVGGRTHFAAKQQFGSSVRYAFPSLIGELLEAVKSGKADCAVIPLGDDGPDLAVLEALWNGDLFITAQILPGGEESGEEGGVGSSRYLVLGTSPNTPSGRDQSALLLHLGEEATPDQAIALLREAGLHPLTLPSLPAHSGSSGLRLFVETAGHADDPALQTFLDSLNSTGITAKPCGSYPALS